MDERIVNALAMWDGIAIEDRIPDRLPLLDRYRDTFGSGDFSAMDLLVIQHHLGTTVPLVRAFIDSGVPADRIWYVDIPYSTNTDVYDALEDLSGPGHSAALFTDPLADYSAAQLMRVTMVLLAMWTERQGRRLLVLDDGAYFIRALNTLRAISHPAADHFAKSLVVEQTTRGHRFVVACKRDVVAQGLRVVSIARAKTKEDFEGPFVGAAVSQSIAKKALGEGDPDSVSKIAILGFGIVGEACARALSSRFARAQIVVVDERPKPRERAEDWLGLGSAFATLPKDLTFDLVVGCTGRNSFTLADRHVLADHALLASGSSAAVEFDRTGFVDLADYHRDDEIEVIRPAKTRQSGGIHADIRMRIENNRMVTFANAGFPINFDGRLECLPLKMIQPTRCLMYAAAVQLLTPSDPGVATLGTVPDSWLLDRALQQLAA